MKMGITLNGNSIAKCMFVILYCWGYITPVLKVFMSSFLVNGKQLEMLVFGDETARKGHLLVLLA